jgi:hypothetical protein
MSGETISQLNPPICVKGPWGWELAVAWIHYGPENEQQWKCINFETGRVVDIPQKMIRGGYNLSVDRLDPEKPPVMPDLAARPPVHPPARPATNRIKVGGKMRRAS